MTNEEKLIEELSCLLKKYGVYLDCGIVELPYNGGSYVSIELVPDKSESSQFPISNTIDLKNYF